jgi:hypothetical protein
MHPTVTRKLSGCNCAFSWAATQRTPPNGKAPSWKRLRNTASLTRVANSSLHRQGRAGQYMRLRFQRGGTPLARKAHLPTKIAGHSKPRQRDSLLRGRRSRKDRAKRERLNETPTDKQQDRTLPYSHPGSPWWHSDTHLHPRLQPRQRPPPERTQHESTTVANPQTHTAWLEEQTAAGSTPLWLPNS